MLRNVSLRTKLFFLVTLVVVVSFLTTAWIVSDRSTQLVEDDAFGLADEMAAKYSNEIKSEIQAARVTSESLMTVFKTLIERDEADRDTLNEILQNSLRQKEYIVSFCVAFEPNKLDGKDAEYAESQPELYGESGRYAPYWSLHDGKIDVEPLSDFDNDVWYAGARDARAEYITDPFFYPVQGEETLMTSLVFPIIIDGEFIGIVSSDMALDSLQEMVSRVNTSGLDEFTEIYSNSGLVVAHPDKQYFNKNVYVTSVHNMLKSDSVKAQDALPIAQAFVENHPLKNSENEEEVQEYNAAVAFVGNLTSYLENPSETNLELASIPNDMAKEILSLDEERLATAEEAMNAIKNGTSFSVVEDDYYKVYMPIQFSEATNPWSVAVNIPMSEVLKASDDIQRYLIITFAIAIVLIAGILFLISSRITKPILNLAKTAGRFGEGDFDAELPAGQGNDEIGILSKAFKDMAQRIKGLIGELQSNAQELKENNERLNYLNEALVATNHVSEIILNVEHQQFQEVLTQSLELLGKSANAAGVFIWQNEKQNDSKVYSRVISSWISGQDNSNSFDDVIVELDACLPDWDDRSQRKECFGAATLDGRSIIENHEMFHDFKSLVLIPLMLQDSYWGFLAFSYFESDHQLKSDESEILRSSGMMLASTILQNETSESLKEAEAMASTDALTCLMNRNGFLMKAPTVYAECRSEELPLSMLFFDLDLFKQVNDEYGHPFGDEVLKAFAGVLQEETGEEDVNCRYGGEEFLLLMKNSDVASGKEMADRILEKVRLIRFPEQPEFSFTVSIGMMTGVPGMHDTLNGYIHKADNALYKAKNNGRNQVVIFTE